MSRIRLGEYLVERGLIAPTELAFALEHHRRTGERLGRILLTLGYVGREVLYNALAEMWRIPFVRLDPEVLDGAVTRRFPVEDCVRFRAIPYRREGDTLVVAVADPPTDDLAGILRQYYGHVTIAWRATTDWDVDQALSTAFRGRMADRGVSQLYYREPEESAIRTFGGLQRTFLVIAAGFLLVLFIRRPMATLQVLNLLAALLLLSVALYRVVAGATGRRLVAPRATDVDLADRAGTPWPMYSVLVPVFRNDRGVEETIAYLTGLDYPSDRFEILLLVDEEDLTAHAAVADAYPDVVRMLAVPSRLPRTKPRACNIGLFYSHGDFLVIYDVEDRPERDQLKRAVVAHRAADAELLAVIGSLTYRNATAGLLARLTAREDAVWFESLLPGMIHLGLPTPLPASSCHYRTRFLRDLGGWDPFNTAADTDLGMRAGMCALRVGMFGSTTSETLVVGLRQWLLQRARWLRGYIQTVLVHGRNPFDLHRRAPRRQVAAFFLFILGTPTAFLLMPASILLTVLGLTITGAAPSPTVVLVAASAQLLAGSLSTFVLLLRVPGGPRAGLPAMLFPLYWMLHAVPAFLAFYHVFLRSRRPSADDTLSEEPSPG